jgi:hypothetical protein
MLYRMMPLFFLVLGFTVSGVRAEEKKADPNVHEGMLVKVDGNQLTMTDRQGKTEHTHTVAANAKILCDAKECKLSDLKPGTKLRVTTKDGDATTALKVEATTKDEKKDK